MKKIFTTTYSVIRNSRTGLVVDQESIEQVEGDHFDDIDINSFPDDVRVELQEIEFCEDGDMLNINTIKTKDSWI